MAQALARERYRRQNDSGFSYQGGKKSFDTLVKEAEQEIIKQKIDNALTYKASDDELARLSQLQKLNQVQIDNLEKQRSDLELKISRPRRYTAQAHPPKSFKPKSLPSVRVLTALASGTRPPRRNRGPNGSSQVAS